MKREYKNEKRLTANSKSMQCGQLRTRS